MKRPGNDPLVLFVSLSSVCIAGVEILKIYIFVGVPLWDAGAVDFWCFQRFSCCCWLVGVGAWRLKVGGNRVCQSFFFPHIFGEH